MLSEKKELSFLRILSEYIALIISWTIFAGILALHFIVIFSFFSETFLCLFCIAAVLFGIVGLIVMTVAYCRNKIRNIHQFLGLLLIVCILDFPFLFLSSLFSKQQNSSFSSSLTAIATAAFGLILFSATTLQTWIKTTQPAVPHEFRKRLHAFPVSHFLTFCCAGEIMSLSGIFSFYIIRDMAWYGYAGGILMGLLLTLLIGLRLAEWYRSSHAHPAFRYLWFAYPCSTLCFLFLFSCMTVKIDQMLFRTNTQYSMRVNNKTQK